jgi:hypothetical protein
VFDLVLLLQPLNKVFCFMQEFWIERPVLCASVQRIINHIESTHIHGRALEATSGIQRVDKHRLDINHDIMNISNLNTDKLLRFLFGPQVKLFYRVFNGNTILPMTRIQGRSNYIWIDIQRIDDHRTQVTMLPVIHIDKRTRVSIGLAKLSLAVRSIFISQFFRAEDPYIQGMKLAPETLVEQDRPIAEFLLWLADRRFA